MKVKAAKFEKIFLTTTPVVGPYPGLRKNRNKGNIVRNKQKMTTFKLLRTSWKYQGRIFFKESTLHGVRYIAETDRPLFERLMWALCVLIGAVATIVIIVSLWDKFQTNPTITGLDTDFHNWDIPFPAITICPNRAWDEQKIDEMYKIWQGKSPDIEDKKTKAFLRSLADISLKNLQYFPKQLEHVGDVLDEDVKELAFKLMLPCEELLNSCKWKSNNYNCCEGFFPIFTENGFCYTFNSRHYERTNSDSEFHLRYIKETDAKWSLEFTLGEVGTLHGFNASIYIHNSDDVPGFDMKPQHVWDFRINKLQFSLRETYTTENANQLSIKQRHCIFDKEVQLDVDEVYTFTACTQQCRMNNAKRLCGCVPHYYLLIKGDARYSYCKFSGLTCIAANLRAINAVDNCICELGCSNTIYEVDKLFPSTRQDDNVTNSFECEFTSWPMIKYKREVLFGWVDLLVSFGGIAGLFLGFSLLSGVELIYYFTIRTCCMIYKQQDELCEMEVNSKNRRVIQKQKTITFQDKLAEFHQLKMPIRYNITPPYFINVTPHEVNIRKISRPPMSLKTQNNLENRSRFGKKSFPIVNVRTSKSYNNVIDPPFGMIDYLN